MLLPSSPSTPPFEIMLYLNHVTIPPAPTPPFEMLLLLPQEFYTLYFVHTHFSSASSSQINPHLLTHLTLCSLFLLGRGPSPGVWLAHPRGHPLKENSLSSPSGMNCSRSSATLTHFLAFLLAFVWLNSEVCVRCHRCCVACTTTLRCPEISVSLWLSMILPVLPQ